MKRIYLMVLAIVGVGLSPAIASAVPALVTPTVNQTGPLAVGTTYNPTTITLTNTLGVAFMLDSLYNASYPAGFTVSGNTCQAFIMEPSGGSSTCTVTGSYTPPQPGTAVWSAALNVNGAPYSQVYSTQPITISAGASYTVTPLLEPALGCTTNCTGTMVPYIPQTTGGTAVTFNVTNSTSFTFSLAPAVGFNAGLPTCSSPSVNGGIYSSGPVGENCTAAVAFVGEQSFNVTPGSNPQGITATSDGHLWFTETAHNAIGESTSNGTVTEHTITNPATSITVGSDGHLWFTEYGADKIGEMDTNGTLLNEYSLTAGSGPWGITAGSDDKVWFTEKTAGKIGVIKTDGTGLNEYAVTASSQPEGITAGPNGANTLWFAEANNAAIGVIQTDGNGLHEYTGLITDGQPVNITVGSDNNLWFTENGGAIGKMDTSGNLLHEYPLLAGSVPWGITAASDGNLWFTTQRFQSSSYTNLMEKITPNGSITVYNISSGSAGSGVYGITVGYDDNLWFVDASQNAIGVF